MSLLGVCHNSLGLTMLFLVLSALFLEVRSPAFSFTLRSCMEVSGAWSLLLVPGHEIACQGAHE